ncbi:MAG: hypothetical protein AAF296_05780 [Pseudomonadota bacterium]
MELSPTGSLHAGTLRLLIFAEEVREHARVTYGISVEHVIRINDLAPEKQTSEPLSHGRKIAAHHVEERASANRLETLEEELRMLYEATGWPLPSLIRVSEIYQQDLFRSLIRDCASRSDLIISILSNYKKSSVGLVYPICTSCDRIQYGFPKYLDSSGAEWVCPDCSAPNTFSCSKSPKILTFKVEQALAWQILGASVDLHGQDHIEAFNASLEIATALELKFLPSAARVNLVFDRIRKTKISKSLGSNYGQIDITIDDLEGLVCRLKKTPFHRPVYI